LSVESQGSCSKVGDILGKEKKIRASGNVPASIKRIRIVFEELPGKEI
jgi:hypothetical protein